MTIFAHRKGHCRGQRQGTLLFSKERNAIMTSKGQRLNRPREEDSSSEKEEFGYTRGGIPCPEAQSLLS